MILNLTYIQEKLKNLWFWVSSFFKNLGFIFLIVITLEQLLWQLVVLCEKKLVFSKLVDTSHLNLGTITSWLSILLFAPLIEEYFFRYPLRLEKNDALRKFYIVLSSFVFGFIHIFNYQLDASNMKFIILITSPQIFLGFVLANIRLRFGFWYGVFFHALSNLIAGLTQII